LVEGNVAAGNRDIAGEAAAVQRQRIGAAGKTITSALVTPSPPMPPAIEPPFMMTVRSAPATPAPPLPLAPLPPAPPAPAAPPAPPVTVPEFVNVAPGASNQTPTPPSPPLPAVPEAVLHRRRQCRR